MIRVVDERLMIITKWKTKSESQIAKDSLTRDDWSTGI